MKYLILFLMLAAASFSADRALALPRVVPPNDSKVINSFPLLPPPPMVSTLDGMSLNEFIRLASKSLGKNILVSGKLEGSIDYLSNMDISKKNLLPLLKSALELNNYALVNNGSYYSVVLAKDLKLYDNVYLGNRSGSSFGSKVLPIRYSDVASILDGVKTLLSASGSAFGVPSSGSLIVSDFPENITLITKLLKEIDVKPMAKNQAFKSFHLVNASADSVSQTLSAIFGHDNNGSIVFSIHQDSNSLFVNGDMDLVDRVPALVADLDREQYQVYIQVRILELNNDLSSKLGMRYGLDGGIVSASNFFSFAGNIGGSSIAPVNELILNNLTGSLGNVKQLLTIGAALDLLQSEGVSKTLSDPSVLCLNNKESKVIVGKSLSFLKGSTTGASGTSSALDRIDVGLNLTIKPLVASKDKLSISIDAVLENILPVLDSNNQPITSKQQIKTDSILHHGETIVLGGFVKSYDSVINDGVPFLSDIPYIGSIFKHSSTITQKDNLLLVITPYIIDDSKSLSALQTDLGVFGKLQKVYNDSLTPNFD